MDVSVARYCCKFSNMRNFEPRGAPITLLGASSRATPGVWLAAGAKGCSSAANKQSDTFLCMADPTNLTTLLGS